MNLRASVRFIPRALVRDRLSLIFLSFFLSLSLSCVFFFFTLARDYCSCVSFVRGARDCASREQRCRNLTPSISRNLFPTVDRPSTYVRTKRISSIFVFLLSPASRYKTSRAVQIRFPRKVYFRRFPTRSEFESDRGKKFVTVTNQQTFHRSARVRPDFFLILFAK